MKGTTGFGRGGHIAVQTRAGADVAMQMPVGDWASAPVEYHRVHDSLQEDDRPAAVQGRGGSYLRTTHGRRGGG